MKFLHQLVTCAVAGLIAMAPAAHAGELYVISNSGTAVAQADVREIFIGEKQFAGSVKLVPVDNAAVQDEFLAKVMKMESGKYASSWTKKAFRDGVSPPPLKGGDAETIEFVRHTAGAVGYVSSSPAGVNVVGKF
jgi:hypothetical protein